MYLFAMEVTYTHTHTHTHTYIRGTLISNSFYLFVQELQQILKATIMHLVKTNFQLKTLILSPLIIHFQLVKCIFVQSSLNLHQITHVFTAASRKVAIAGLTPMLAVGQFNQNVLYNPWCFQIVIGPGLTVFQDLWFESGNPVSQFTHPHDVN